MGKILWIFALVVIFGIGFFILYLNKSNSKETGSGPIVFLGDSLTAGEGVAKGEDFPTLVGIALKREVVNAGVPGDTTADALLRVDRDVLSKNPSIVVVELGGNDFLERVGFVETKKNFDQIMEKFARNDVKLVIVSTRTGVINDKYIVYEKELSQKYHAVYVDNILKGVFGNGDLMADAVHPNKEGYKVIAERIAKILRPML